MKKTKTIEVYDLCELSNDLFEKQNEMYAHLTALSADRFELSRLIGTCGTGVDNEKCIIYSDGVGLKDGSDEFAYDMVYAACYKLSSDVDALMTYMRSLNKLIGEASSALGVSNSSLGRYLEKVS